MIKKISKAVIMMITLLGIGMGAMHAVAPSFDDNFANYLTDKTPDQYGRVETVFSFSNCIDRNQSIMENVRNLFYPSTFKSDNQCSLTTGGLLWDMLRVITFALIFVFIVVAGMKFIMNGTSGDEAKKGAMSLVYIAYGAFLVFGAIWILGYVLNIENVKGSTDLVNSVQNNLFLQILSFFKVLAFFLAIIMMVVSGFKMMAAMDKEDKVKAGKQGAINVIVALVFIKIVDYIFYIAQASDFAQKASTLVLDVAKILGWILGISFVLGLFYAGYQMFLSGGDEKAIKKTQSILINIVIVSLVLFLFLLLVYQIFNEFVG
ncbi:hypothetical protein P148_SR1C00001G0155 [candidate division SR1 bacterium RAAC1_SR1_1]|nr:hypothetical protein P148_SR1C00001G0155 [candidate division SR1 bacterium RAAC1_SR1_1]